MANKSFFEALTQYRLKVEKDGKDVLNVPGIFALPGMLMVPKLSLTGLIAAPLLGLKIHVEGESGETFDIEDAVRKAAEAVKESVTMASKTIKEEIDKASEGLLDDDPEGSGEEDVAEEAEDNKGETEDPDASDEDSEEALKCHEENGAPTVEVMTDDSPMA